MSALGCGLVLWAAHISDAFLTPAWTVGGFLAAGVLALVGAWRIREEEIAQTAVLTAAFFVASLIHVRVGPTSVHLLLNGLLGVILGRRALLAVPVGLFLQAVLLQHGGYTTLGINSCIMGIPALAAWQLFGVLQRLPWLRQAWFRMGLVGVSTLAWTLSLVFSVALLLSNGITQIALLETDWAQAVTCHPVTLLLAGVVMIGVVWAERRLANPPEFPLGLLIGVLTVLLTMGLNFLVLLLGGEQRESWRMLALVTLVAHLPIAVVEGAVLGFTVGFLYRVKPEMLEGPRGRLVNEAHADRPATLPGGLQSEKSEWSVEPLS